jgi:flagellar hook assembly protein FlgD
MSAVASARSPGGAVRVWPNPTNPGTTISYALTTAGPATVRLYDLAGRHVRTLASGDHNPGRHTVHWDGRDAGGAPVAAGVYHVVVAHDGSHGVARVTVVK